MHQLVHNRVNCHDLFLSDAGEVVVKRTSVYDVLSSLSEICCLVNNCRRISCSRSDPSPSGRKDCCHDARSSGCRDELDRFVLHHDVAGLQCRMLHGTSNVVRAARLQGRLIQKVNRVDRSLDRCRMRVKYNRIPCREHSDRVAEDCLAGVCTRSDRSDHSEGSHLDQGKSSVS